MTDTSMTCAAAITRHFLEGSPRFFSTIRTGQTRLTRRFAGQGGSTGRSSLAFLTGREGRRYCRYTRGACPWTTACCRSEEHTSELQSQFPLVCRLLLDKK